VGLVVGLVGVEEGYAVGAIVDDCATAASNIRCIVATDIYTYAYRGTLRAVAVLFTLV
jgi:hypothetical protein